MMVVLRMMTNFVLTLAGMVAVLSFLGSFGRFNRGAEFVKDLGLVRVLRRGHSAIGPSGLRSSLVGRP